MDKLFQEGMEVAVSGAYCEEDYPVYYINAAFCELLGYESKEDFCKATESKMKHVVYEGDLLRVKEEIGNAIVGQEYKTSFRLLGKDGKMIWVVAQGRFIFTADNRVAIMGYCLDVSHLMKQQEEIAEKRLLVQRQDNKTLDIVMGIGQEYKALAYVDLDQDVIHMQRSDNRDPLYLQAEQKMSFSLFKERFLTEYVHEEDRERVGAAIDVCGKRSQLERNKVYMVRFKRLERDKSFSYEEVRFAIVGNGKRAVMGRRDVDAEIRKQIEDERREKERNALISGLGKVFFAIYEIDLKTDYFKEIVSIPSVRQVVGKEGNAQEALDSMADKLCMPEYKGQIRLFNDLGTIAHRLQGKTLLTQEFVGVTAGWSLACVFPVEKDEQGEIRRIAYLARSIAAEKEKDEAHVNLINALASSYNDIYVVRLDDGSMIRYAVSEAMQRRYGNVFAGGDYEKALSLYLNNDVYEEDKGLFDIIRTRKDCEVFFTARNSYTFNYRVKREGELHYFQCQLVKPSIERNEFAVGFKNVDEEVRAHVEAQQALKNALQAAEDANKAKSIFLNNMSHDIRTPMNAIMGYTSLAISHLDEREKVLDFLEKIQTSGDHLLSLINDVLDMSRIESGKVVLQEQSCSLLKIMKDISNIIQADMKEKQLDLYFDTMDVENELVYCDNLRVRQVLINCISNAVKFTPDGGTINVKIKEMPHAGEGYASYRFIIKDTGIGMSEGFLEHYFEPFERERNSTVSGIQGTGLGMSITKNIVDMVGGTIQVESEVGKGTKITIDFTFKLSAETENGYEAPKTDEITENTSLGDRFLDFGTTRVLVVEDNPMNMEIAVDVLTEAGFLVDTAENGLIAFEKIRDSVPGQYSVILMDIQMPLMDGLEATKKIRELKNNALAEIPIVAMTANAFEEDRLKCMQVGMNRMLVKPFKIKKLIQVLQSIGEKDGALE